jgi:hypothetical protein
MNKETKKVSRVTGNGVHGSVVPAETGSSSTQERSRAENYPLDDAKRTYNRS